MGSIIAAETPDDVLRYIPEHRLLAAVLTRALTDLEGRSGEDIQRKAVDWFKRRYSHSFPSYDDCIFYLSLSHHIQLLIENKVSTAEKTHEPESKG